MWPVIMTGNLLSVICSPEMKMLLLQCSCALRKFHMIDGPNTHDQIPSDRTSTCEWSNCVMWIPLIPSGSPNECWLHTCDARIITNWRLGLRAVLVAPNKCVNNSPWHKLKIGPTRPHSEGLSGLQITDSRLPVMMTGHIFFSPDKPRFWPVK